MVVKHFILMRIHFNSLNASATNHVYRLVIKLNCCKLVHLVIKLNFIPEFFIFGRKSKSLRFLFDSFPPYKVLCVG